MTAPAVLESRTFDELAVGDSATLTRRLTRADFAVFAAAAGMEAAAGAEPDGAGPWSSEIGQWAMTFLASLIATKLPGPGATIVSQTVTFDRPAKIDEAIAARITVRGKERDGASVRIEGECTNEAGARVAVAEFVVRAPATKQRVVPGQQLGYAVQLHEPYNRLIERCRAIEAVPTAVAYPCDASSLAAAADAAKAGLIAPILVGPGGRIGKVAEEQRIDLGPMRLVEAESAPLAAAQAVALVRSGEAELLMKGSLHTDELMAAVVRRETGLRTARRVSHCFVMAVPTYARPLIVTDAAVNIAPTLDEKVDIVQNAIDLSQALGVKQPRVAILSAVETVTSKIASTIDAAALCKMADRGQIAGGLLDGPLALDNAISEAAARTKGIASPVAGHADILLVPDLEAGNMLAKNLTFMAQADAAGIVLGAKVPIILTSRADNLRTRLASCAVAALFAHSRRAASGG